MTRPWYNPRHPAVQQRAKLDLDPTVDEFLAMFSNDVYDGCFVDIAEVEVLDKVNDR